VQVGIRRNFNGQSIDLYFDDLVISDTAFVSTTGEYGVGVLKPNANGSTMTWNQGTGASDYTQVDEIPIDDADYVMSPLSGSPNVALFDLQSLADASISAGAIFAVKGIVICRENTNVSSSHFIRIRSNSTNSDGGNFTDGNTSSIGLGRVLGTDPHTSSAWSKAAIDDLELGIVENNAANIRAESVLLYVLYEVSTNTDYELDLTENVGLQDTLSKSQNRIIANNLGVVGTLAKAPSRNLSENVSVLDTLVRLGQKVFSEVVSLIDTTIRNATRIFSEIVVLEIGRAHV
jgi:hypothetical protein